MDERQRRQLRDLTRIYRWQQNGEARRIRTEAGVSVRALARAVGIRPSQLSRWENQHARPREAAALRWVAALDQIRAELERDGQEPS